MTVGVKAPVLVVVQLAGAIFQILIPYTNGIYYDSRRRWGFRRAGLALNDTLAFHPRTEPLKRTLDAGKVAIVQGIGYPNSNRSPLPGHGYLAHLRAHKSSEGCWARPSRSRSAP